MQAYLFPLFNTVTVKVNTSGGMSLHTQVQHAISNNHKKYKSFVLHCICKILVPFLIDKPFIHLKLKLTRL